MSTKAYRELQRCRSRFEASGERRQGKGGVAIAPCGWVTNSPRLGFCLPL
ncbi:hypothetical protein [Phormidium sp. CCY1219]|nr:hypothetical protein [Phormidium sp. CCY1219]